MNIKPPETQTTTPPTFKFITVGEGTVTPPDESTRRDPAKE